MKSPGEQECITRLQRIASSSLAAIITYRKPGEDWRTERFIEPYSLSFNRAGNTIVLTWQLTPTVGEPYWRNFRADRIQSVKSSAQVQPRAPVTIHLGETKQFRFDEPGLDGPPTPMQPQARYFEHLEASLLDGQLDVKEMTEAVALRKDLDEEQIRAIHAQVYANLIDEMVMDGRLSRSEEDRLAGSRVYLTQLGWCP